MLSGFLTSPLRAPWWREMPKPKMNQTHVLPSPSSQTGTHRTSALLLPFIYLQTRRNSPFLFLLPQSHSWSLRPLSEISPLSR